MPKEKVAVGLNRTIVITPDKGKVVVRTPVFEEDTPETANVRHARNVRRVRQGDK